MTANGAMLAEQVKPWFQQELERVTRERWTVLAMPRSARIECRHGMLIMKPFSPGCDRPFLNSDQEREFVRKVLLRHAQDYRLSYREGQRG